MGRIGFPGQRDAVRKASGRQVARALFVVADDVEPSRTECVSFRVGERFWRPSGQVADDEGLAGSPKLPEIGMVKAVIHALLAKCRPVQWLRLRRMVRGLPGDGHVMDCGRGLRGVLGSTRRRCPRGSVGADVDGDRKK